MQVQIIFSRDSELASVLENIVSQQNIPMDSEASVFVGRDTRKSSPALSTAVLDGVNSVKVGFVQFCLSNLCFGDKSKKIPNLVRGLQQKTLASSQPR